MVELSRFCRFSYSRIPFQFCPQMLRGIIAALMATPEQGLCCPQASLKLIWWYN